MPEHDFVRADRDRKIAEWRLADALTVDPDFRPRRGVAVHDALGQIDREACHLAGHHLDSARDSVPQRFVDELDGVGAGREHQAIGIGRADDAAFLTNLGGNGALTDSQPDTGPAAVVADATGVTIDAVPPAWTLTTCRADAIGVSAVTFMIARRESLMVTGATPRSVPSTMTLAPAGCVSTRRLPVSGVLANSRIFRNLGPGRDVDVYHPGHAAPAQFEKYAGPPGTANRAGVWP